MVNEILENIALHNLLDIGFDYRPIQGFYGSLLFDYKFLFNVTVYIFYVFYL